MAWRCTSSTNRGLIENLKRGGILSTPRAEAAMLAVDRRFFAPENPYMDSPVGIGHRATISAPHMHAFALSNLEPFLQPGMRALDVGCGSGFLTACMAHMVGPEGFVVGVDHIRELVEMSENNIKRGIPEILATGHVRLITGDGRKDTFTISGEIDKFDAIHVGAAADGIPHALVDQLASPGRMVIPVGSQYDYQMYMQIDKDSNGNVSKQPLMGVSFVPLTDPPKLPH